jgi:Isochorismatase family
MRLPGDATLIIVAPAHRSDSGVDAVSMRERQARIAALETAWRTAGLPLVHIRQAALAARGPGAVPSGEAEATLSMSETDVFLSTGLADLLTQRGATTVVLCGTLGDPVRETAVQQACALGFRTFVVIDAADGATLDHGEAVGAPDARDGAISVDTATALEAAARAAVWRQERAKRPNPIGR